MTYPTWRDDSARYTPTTNDRCVGCTLRLANDQDAICDGSGVIAITDYPAARVVICPAWPCDEDEPLAYWEAIDGLDYDVMPLTLQQRMRATVMAEVDRLGDTHAPYADGPADEVKRTPLIRTIAVLALITLAVFSGIFYPWGGLV